MPDGEIGGLHVVGTTKLEDVKTEAAKKSDKWASALETAARKAKQDHPTAGAIFFKGNRPHKSNKDKTETREVISVRLHEGTTESGKVIKSGHITEDGSIKYSSNN